MPESILLECLIALDAYQFADSAVRMHKGRWEKQFVQGLKARGVDCRKRKFSIGDQEFELDIAYPATGDIRLGVDIKMVGHPSDKHKRGDEIVNKAVKFKEHYPNGSFVSIVHYPFDVDRDQFEDRLRSGTKAIDKVIFAGDDEGSIVKAVEIIHKQFVT